MIMPYGSAGSQTESRLAHGSREDLLIVPLGILLAVRLVPGDLMAEFRASAVSADGERVLRTFGAAIIVALWILGIALATLSVGALLKRS